MSEHIGKLHEVLTGIYPQLILSIHDSPKRYDDLIHGDGTNFSFHNDFFILIVADSSTEVILEAVCLYIPSLLIKIKKSQPLVKTIPTESISQEVKNYLYSMVLQHQTWLFQRISENTWHLASGLSHERITQHVVDGALKTIPFSDAVIFRIYDEKNNLLRPVAVSGFQDNYYDYSVSPQESISGKVFESKKPIILNSKKDILSSFKDYSAIRVAVMKNNPIANSLICVPVFDQQHCYGTLTILSLGRHSVFNSLAVSLLETFASQVALAWRNAKLYDEKVESYNQANDLRKQLEQQNQVLKSSIEFHNEMIRLSIKNNDISLFMKEISDKINVEIGYIDISGATYSKSLEIDNIWAELSVHKPNLNFDGMGFVSNEMYVQPIRKNKHTVGLVVVKKSDASDYIKMTLSRLSDFLIMDIMKKVNILLIENKRKSSVIDKILLHGLNEDTLSTLSENGFLIQEWVGCMVFTTEAPKVGNEDVLLLDIYNKLKLTLSRRNAFIYIDGNTFKVFLSDNFSDRISSLFNRIEKEVINVGLYQAGISNVNLASRIKQSLEQAMTALAVVKKRSKLGILQFNQTGIERLFVNHEKEEMKSFVQDVLSPILDESDKSQILLKTLNNYIGSSCSINNTAKALDIHVNTLYQRIKKIELLTKMDLSKPDDFLIISVACHMLTLL